MAMGKVTYKVYVNNMESSRYLTEDFKSYGKAVKYVRKSMRKILGNDYREKVSFVDDHDKLYKSKDGRYMWTIYEIVTTTTIKSLNYSIK